MRGRINLTQQAIRDKLAGSKDLKHAEVVAAVRAGLIKSTEYAGLGGTAETVRGDVRRALAALRTQGYASSKGVTATMRWSVYARRRSEPRAG